MKWQQVRQNHPDRWLLVEAAQAHTEADRRILDDLVVLDTYEDSAVAMREYTQIHRQRPDRELYVLVGVGGGEFVYCKRLPWVALGNCRALDFPVEIGAMSYGFEIDGIPGMDFMQQVGLLVDLHKLEVSCGATDHVIDADG